MPQHVDDLVAFIESLGSPVNLLGHSRGGHIAFRVAQARPDLVRRLIFAEPGGELEADLMPAGQPPILRRPALSTAAEKIAGGDVDGGLELFVDAVDGDGAWRGHSEAVRQSFRDNAYTLLGQVNDRRSPYSLADAKSMGMPTLFIGGEHTSGSLRTILQTLARHVPDTKLEIIPGAKHLMFVEDPVRFFTAVAHFAELT